MAAANRKGVACIRSVTTQCTYPNCSCAAGVEGRTAGIHVEACECHNCGHIGINDSHPTEASCSECDWTGLSPKEDHCPGCGEDGTMHLACPKCSHRYHTIAEATVGVTDRFLQAISPHTPPIPEEPQSPTTTGGEKTHAPEGPDA